MNVANMYLGKNKRGMIGAPDMKFRFRHRRRFWQIMRESLLDGLTRHDSVFAIKGYYSTFLNFF